MAKPAELPAKDLRRNCDSAALGFEITSELPILGEILGQPRAVAALAFGATMASHGFNLFALGQPGSGKTTLIREYLERRAADRPVPPDLCYVNNFADARRPIPLQLPPGRAASFKCDIDAFVDVLKAEIPKAFDSEEYTRHRDNSVQELETRRREAFTLIEKHVEEGGFQLLKGPGGLLLAPSVGGKLLTEQDLEALKPEEREKVMRVRERLQHFIEERLREIRELEKAARDKLHSLDTETAAFATRHLMDDLRSRYHDQPAVLDYLDAFATDIVGHADDFRKGKEAETPQPPIAMLMPEDRALSRYRINVLVDNGGLKGAPVIVETNPTYHNLTGRIEHQANWFGMVTDHTMIKAGALHRANGGYLIIPARECLMNPFAWDGLKRALNDGALRIEELGTQLSMVSTVSLAPEPVPIQVKVVLIGNPLIYYVLYANDEDFQKLFKVKADFTTKMPRDRESERAYALFVNTITREDKSAPFDRAAVARIIEYGSRAVEDQDHLSTRFGDIADLIREAGRLASQNSHEAVRAVDVRAAEEARRYRQNLVEEHLQEALLNGTVLIDPTGSAVGRINGLSVVSMGDYAFGHPVRITAAVGPGRRGVVSIEREVELSGPIHGKGVLILGGYLLHRYGQGAPLSLSGSLVFEQSYSMVEGDSASLAELCVLLSAASAVPLRQDIAVTGSVNQHGQVQAVGGVAEKIEGFFDICRGRGLTGTQGVLIPAANRRHLMLRDEVVEAVTEGQFHVWAAERVDDALELLTGLPAGEPDSAGAFPAGSVHRGVADRLVEYAEELREFGDDRHPSPSGTRQ